LDAIQLHELYKQRSTIETWIEQVKGQAMAGATLTYDFWPNDILWQAFIDWFIAVPAKITRSGHQTEIKLCEHHFYKADCEEMDRLIEAA
jgi:hypothetical protein